VGVAGLGGLITGIATGALAMSAWKSSQGECGSTASCPQHAQAVTDHDSALTKATISTVGFVAGGVLIAGGVTMFVLGGKPTGAAPATTGLVLLPTLGPRAAALSISGGF
jgi:hypothetical protein